MSLDEIQIMLPESDIVESGYLESMLKRTGLTNSYKLFWFRALFYAVQEECQRISYYELVVRMIASAWYPVVYYKLNLGQSDQLSDVIFYIRENLKIPKDAKEEQITEMLLGCSDKELIRRIKKFYTYVPYRLIRPFYQREIDAERKVNSCFSDSKINAFVELHNRRDDGHVLYIMDKENECLTISDKWAEYLKINRAVIEGWLNYKIIDYVQKRNPNIPAIPFKIFPPTVRERNLSKETKMWRKIMAKQSITDIYTSECFSDENYKKYGKLSLDHFIPYSFVRHNEVWNLYPMFSKINSKKNDRLPEKSKYLDVYCERQYNAFIILKTLDGFQSLKDQYLNVKSDIYEMGEDDRGHDAFVNAVRGAIEPLYEIANHQGYEIWSY